MPTNEDIEAPIPSLFRADISSAIDLLVDNGYVVIDNNKARSSWGGHTETARATEGVTSDE